MLIGNLPFKVGNRKLGGCIKIGNWVVVFGL